MANSTSGESVIHRVVRILGAFADDAPALYLRELSRKVDLPVSTVHRLVGELEIEGLLVRDPSGRLRHGHRLWELASRGSRAASLRESALPVMEDLAAHTGHNISLGVLEGTDVLYIERLALNESVVNITRIAGRLPVHGCSGGLVFMAFAPEADQERFLSRRLEKLTDATVTDSQELRKVLAIIRQTGYCSMAGIIVDESSGISVPIFADGDQPLACLTAIVTRGQENVPALVPQMQMAARAISRRLGYNLAPVRTMRRSLPAPN